MAYIISKQIMITNIEKQIYLKDNKSPGKGPISYNNWTKARITH